MSIWQMFPSQPATCHHTKAAWAAGAGFVAANAATGGPLAGLTGMKPRGTVALNFALPAHTDGRKWVYTWSVANQRWEGALA